MHILLTDVLSCPRCGPGFGLVLLADRVEERRVLEGRLGCPNCREQYPVRGGALDARLPGAAPAAEDEAAPEDDPGAAVRLAALLGLADARGTVLVAGPGAALAPEIAALVPELEVVALAAAPDEGEERPGVSRVAAGAALPFRGGTLRGVALTGGADPARLAEAARVLQPGARLVVERAAAGTAEALAALGAQVMLEQEGTVVARRVGEPVPLTMNAVR
ncbi:MAG: Trm112 family protein [Longimicrobiaceae bacterium]